MTVADEDALVCDFAQYYGVLDWRSLPLPLAATLAQGLPAEARSKSGGGVAMDTLLMAVIADRLGHIAWMFSQDGSKGVNHPPSILAAITNKQESGNGAGFETGEDFEAAWAAIAGGDASGN